MLITLMWSSDSLATCAVLKSTSWLVDRDLICVVVSAAMFVVVIAVMSRALSANAFSARA